MSYNDMNSNKGNAILIFNIYTEGRHEQQLEQHERKRKHELQQLEQQRK